MTTGYKREALYLLLLVIITAAASYLLQEFLWKKIPELKKDKLNEVSTDLERQFAGQVVSFIEKDRAVITNPVITTAVDSIIQRFGTSDSFPRKIKIIVVDSKVVNAVALPGGVIIVFSSLLRLTEVPEEFAAVLAHEAAHVINRDPLKRMIRQLGISTVLNVMGGNSPYLQSTIESLLDCTYTREQESAADSIALEILQKASISPSHFASFMNRLDMHADEPSTGITKYFSTHPDIIERIQKANTMALTHKVEERPLKIDWKKVKNNLPSMFE